jgi:VWFA-related protein
MSNANPTRIGLGLLGVLLLASVSRSPGQVEPETYSEVVDVSVVNVEVVVTDKSGRPVLGLDQSDFELLADGRQVDLTNFFEMNGDSPHSPTDYPAASTAPVDATAGVTAVIVVDNSSIHPTSRKALFDRLRQYLLEQVVGETRYIVVSMGPGMKLEVPTTTDRNQVLLALQRIEKQSSLFAANEGQRKMLLSRLGHASLRRYQPRSPLLESDPEFEDAIRVAKDLAITTRTLAEQRYQSVKKTYQTLAHLSDALAGLPGRKALLYLSDGLPLRPADSLFEAWTGKYENWVIQNEDDMRLHSRSPDAPSDFYRLMTSNVSSQFDLQNQLNRLVTSASAAKVAFYPVSAGGGNATFVSAEVSGAGMHGDVGAGGMQRNSTRTENLTRDATLLRMAEDTGGAALLRSTNIGDFINRMQQDFTNYYSLGFEPPEDGADGKLRDLQVKVGNGQFIVRYPRGFVAKSWRQKLGERTAAAAIYAQESNPLGVQVDPGVESPDGNRFLVPLMVKIPFEQIRLIHKDQHFNAQLTVLVLVSDADGGLSETHRVDLPIKIPDTRVLERMNQTAAYPVELRMQKGRKRIAVGVRDHLSGAESAINIELQVGRGTQPTSG